MLSRSEKKLLNAALRSANTDALRIFPAKPNAKTPAIAKWPERATTSSETLTRLWELEDFNPAVACGFTKRIVINGVEVDVYLVVVDYDMKPGQLGAKALARHTLLGLADTRTIQTPNGIHKYYWSLRPIPNSQSRIAPNVDVRGVRGYVIGEGAIIEGVEYHRVGEFDEIAFMPAELETAAAKGDPAQQNESTNNKQPIGELDRPEAIETVKRWIINHAPEAIEGSGGDQATYRVAAHIKDLGISEEKCLDLMFDNWNEQKAIPPWAFDALRTKVRNAYAYGQNAPGAASALNEFPVENRESEPPTTTQQGLYRLSYRERVNRAGKTSGTPLINGLLKQGTLNVMYGPSNSGKTFAAMDMAYAIGAGLPWNGMKTAKGLVVYVAAEGGPGVNDRTAALDIRRKPASDPLFDVVPCPIDLLRGNGPDSHAAKLLALIRDAEKDHGAKCVLLVIDTLSRALAGGDENSSVDMGAFIKHVDQLRAATGSAVLVVHHSGKDIARGARGWSGVQAALDTEIEINQGVFSVTKQRDLATIEDLRFTLDAVQVATDEDGQPIYSCVVLWGATAEFQTEATPPEAALIELIRDFMTATGQDTVSPKKLLAYTDTDFETLSPKDRDQRLDTTRARIKRLEQRGLLRAATRGYWKLPPTTPTETRHGGVSESDVNIFPSDNPTKPDTK